MKGSHQDIRRRADPLCMILPYALRKGLSYGIGALRGIGSHLAGILDHQLLNLMESIPIGVWSGEEPTILYSTMQDVVNIINVLVADLRHFQISPSLPSLELQMMSIASPPQAMQVNSCKLRGQEDQYSLQEGRSIPA